ncbi:MAG: class I SAM-dependent methyltransferase [Actinomycetota bacterium]
MTVASGEAYWSERAAVWLADSDALEVVGGPPGEAAMDRLGPQPGERILDIGCGAGSTSIALARRVQPGGHVLGIDIAPGMVAGARRRAEAASVPVQFAAADAQVHDFGETFDGAFSRFGIMFFADPVAAFTNIRKAARRLSFCCWQQPGANEWMVLPNMVALGVLGATPPPPEPGAPGPFAFADAGYVRQILGDAGFSTIDIARSNERVELPEAEIASWIPVALRHGLVGQLLRDAPEAYPEVAKELDEELWFRVKDGVARLSRGVLLVTAR